MEALWTNTGANTGHGRQKVESHGSSVELPAPTLAPFHDLPFDS